MDGRVGVLLSHHQPPDDEKPTTNPNPHTTAHAPIPSTLVHCPFGRGGGLAGLAGLADWHHCGTFTPPSPSPRFFSTDVAKGGAHASPLDLSIRPIRSLCRPPTPPAFSWPGHGQGPPMASGFRAIKVSSDLHLGSSYPMYLRLKEVAAAGPRVIVSRHMGAVAPAGLSRLRRV